MVRVSRKTKNVIYRVFTIILSMALFAGAIFGIYKLVEKSKEKTKTIHPSFSVGELTETGEFKESSTSLYSERFKCQGLTIEIDFNHSISYSIYFYDKDGKFKSNVENSDDDFISTSVPEDAIYARIVITPDKVDNTAVELNWLNKGKYTKQLHITVNKEQKTIEAE